MNNIYTVRSVINIAIDSFLKKFLRKFVSKVPWRDCINTIQNLLLHFNAPEYAQRLFIFVFFLMVLDSLEHLS